MTSKATDPAPLEAADLCGTCGQGVHLDPSTTAFSCEHGSWTFTPGEPAPAEPVAVEVTDELRAEVLGSLDEETLRALLAKVAPPAPVEPVVVEKPAPAKPSAK